ncbi:MAG TPA: response regulator [Candidatus Nitrosotalea sp.]|nr:response regulator [Candidatus Nitrosotalea sp.]
MARILAIDDEADFSATIKSGLEAYGFEVETYNDPELVLSQFKASKYDMVLLDFDMPKMDGIDVFQEIRRRDGDVRICFLSGYDKYYKEFNDLFPESGVRLFIQKPIGIAELVSRINSELNPPIPSAAGN